MASNDSSEIRDTGETSEEPGLPSGTEERRMTRNEYLVTSVHIKTHMYT